jgi:hypothetical protein
MRKTFILMACLVACLGAAPAQAGNPGAGMDPHRPAPSAAAALQQVVLAYARDPWSNEARARWRAYLVSADASAEQIQSLIERVLREAEAYRGVHPESRDTAVAIAEWRNRARGSLGRVAAEFS